MNMKLYYWHPFALMVLFASCSEHRGDHSLPIVDDAKAKRETAFKIINHFKNGEVDSAIAYIVYHSEEDTLYFKYQLASVQRLMVACDQRLIVKDSIFIADSMFKVSNWTWDYRMNFYDSSKKYVGNISLSFLGNMNKYAGNLFASEAPKDVLFEYP
jgi:hypothetical protein